MILKTMSVQISDAEIIAYANAAAVMLKKLLSTDEVAELSAGAPMTHKLFPLIWPANLA